MTSNDPLTCRRALREIREIAAVALLDGAQMSEQEALQTIGAIAGWVAEAGSSAPKDCGDVIRRLDALVGSTDIDDMDDRTAMTLFREVTAVVQGRTPTLDTEPAS